MLSSLVERCFISQLGSSWVILMLGRWVAFFQNGINGRQPKRIIGPAEKVCSGERSYQVSVWKASHCFDDMFYKCCGSVLDETHILTAAHCINGTQPSQLIIQAGCVDLMDLDSIVERVSRVHIHPEYRFLLIDEDEIMMNDIAILTLESPLPLGQSVTTVQLPTTDVKIGQSGKVAGWGSMIPAPGIKHSHSLLETSMKVLSVKNCPILIPTTLFCAIDPAGRKTTGTGDSGSPFVINNTVVGLLSVGNDDALSPVFYTRIFSYIGFINTILQDNTEDFGIKETEYIFIEYKSSFS